MLLCLMSWLIFMMYLRETLMGKHKIGNPRELNLFFF
ncbi:hypothetical protein GLYMA_13G294350v4 [Glycine max]|nr:hypothetical protein GLYMA_13G294350v4 [Glycine max]KAH1103991.1 hypothetical protein GYH30_037755 [Glycine max]